MAVVRGAVYADSTAGAGAGAGPKVRFTACTKASLGWRFRLFTLLYMFYVGFM